MSFNSIKLYGNGAGEGCEERSEGAGRGGGGGWWGRGIVAAGSIRLRLLYLLFNLLLIVH